MGLCSCQTKQCDTFCRSSSSYRIYTSRLTASLPRNAASWTVRRSPSGSPSRTPTKEVCGFDHFFYFLPKISIRFWEIQLWKCTLIFIIVVFFFFFFSISHTSGDPVLMMYKSGDDLRQDMLTLQIMVGWGLVRVAGGIIPPRLLQRPFHTSILKSFCKAGIVPERVLYRMPRYILCTVY